MAVGGRPIDVPLEGLPPIDEHSVHIAAPASEAWDALVHVVGGAFGGRVSTTLARVLGCAETEASGDLSHPGGTIPGFVVARVIPPALLALLGTHRFARYALVFRIDDLDEEGSRLRAETRADFPGPHGRAYRTLVIGTRGHVLVVRRLLRAVRKRAERA
jgi:hypothetical protein